ncbi:MAG: alpha/beta fold hydrolase [Alcanivoracaceae bacterium]
MLRILLLALVATLPACASWVSPTVSPRPLSYDMAPGADEAWLLESRDEHYLMLFGQWWLPDSGRHPRAIVLLLHGTVAHSGFYFPMAEHYAAQDVAVFGLDLRGWGQSQGYGRRGQVRDYDSYLTDVRTAVEEIRQHYPDLPLFIQGESMGGTIALLSQIKQTVPVDGLILNAPAVQPGLYFGPLRTPRLVADGGLAALAQPGKLIPNMPLPVHMRTMERLFARFILPTPEIRAYFMDDPHATHTSLPWSYLTSLHDAVGEVRAGLESIHTPVLIQHGTKDVLVPVSSSEYAMERLASADKALVIYEGVTHATLHDVDRQQVWADALEWLDQQLDRRADQLALEAPHRSETP